PLPPPPPPTLFPYTTLFRSEADIPEHARIEEGHLHVLPIFLVNRSVPLQAPVEELRLPAELAVGQIIGGVRQRRAVLRHTAGVRSKSTRLNSSHLGISYAVF